MIRASFLLAALTAFGFAGMPAAAQSQFSPRVVVNDRVISNYEVSQRVKMLELFQAPGDIETEALDGLIEDRLRLVAAQSMGLSVAPEQVMAGMEEFAGRANLTAEQFVTALEQGGVSAQTFRDFVEAGLLWREVVRARFAPAVEITEVEVDRALSAITQGVNTRVLLAEILIPFEAGNESAALSLARSLRGGLTTDEEFGQAARRYSSSSTAGRGGRLDWMPLPSVPEEVRGTILQLAPGQITPPVRLAEGYAIYQLREIDRSMGRTSTTSRVEYAEMALPPGPDGVAQAARIRASVDTCNDLYGQILGQPEDSLRIETRPQAQVPGDIAPRLAALDENESTDFPRGGAHVFLMLCSRLPDIDGAPTRDEARELLVNQRLASLADAYLEELRAEAIIRDR
ncbi:peptidylprolyl isomerase [Szabonella alba]|uniref:Parvulin-like PPIase n=1 Tax=Szabonella alba TaxID=2804194 RepID=A0A8K0V7V1_9RHOB|nr:peptidylprolyl isomerase [Szabonella alba]MBL4917092.1 peptidylprolyl isomerase [Szabonella alba]